MGVPGFYSWLIKRYPLVKHLIEVQQVPIIDYLYLDMNGIIYKCVKDDSIIFKSQILPKEMESIWLDIFNYINMLVNILKPNKMIVLGLDGVAPRAKMNNQRSRRFKSSRDHKKHMEQLHGFMGTTESLQNFKNNSISPGTAFMEELGKNLEFFIKKKIQEDDYWKSLSVIFTSSSTPGEGEHKIMQFIRANKDNFEPEDSHCLYGADADLIMLSMTLPLKNLCIIREQYVHGKDQVKIAQSKKQKLINFEMIFITILREYFEIQYAPLAAEMKIPFDLDRVIKDFVFLFFFIGNDFLPRCMAYNIRLSSIEDLIEAFKEFLKMTQDYVIGPNHLNLKSLTLLTNTVALRESKFIDEKAQDFDKFLQDKLEKKQFQTQFNQLIQQKTMVEQNFILQLKTFYKNNQLQARNLYYGKYFNINPAENPQQFYKILAYYLSGLQFVYEYYFICLPSWQWFYPYYCAPLVSDLFFYLNYLATLNYELPKLQTGTPFHPFKQLLCILPKQSSQLLPEAFRKYLLDQNSILRSPLDYYPDEFEEEPYGSVRTHEYIALIPFLNLDTINKVYDEAITKVDAKDLHRNQFHDSTLYQYDPNVSPVTIESKFESIPQTTCTIAEQKVNLRQRIKWGRNAPTIKPLQQNLFKMPSLKTKQFFSTAMQSQRKKYFVIQLKTNGEQSKFKLDEQIFYGYPLQKSGKIQAVLTRQNFMFKDEFDGYNYNLDRINRDFAQRNFIKQRTKIAFESIKDDLSKVNRFQFQWSNIGTLVFVKDTQQFVRCLDGNFKRVYHGSQYINYEIVPAPLISRTKMYQNTMDKVTFKSLEEEFGLGEDVLVFPQSYSVGKDKDKDNNKLYVQKGKVVGYTDSKVKVRLGQKIHQIEDKRLENVVHTREIYFTLKFCSFILQIKPDVLLTLLETINIEISDPKLPPSIDIGLNFINRQEEKLVPNLVRINFENVEPNGRDNIQKLFRVLDISLKGLQLIIEYKKRFPNIFKFIQDRYQKLLEKRDEKGRINWREPIKIQQIYGEEEKHTSLKSLMNVYLWLIKKQETHMPLSSIYSKQISAKNIRKLEEILKVENNSQKKRKYGNPIVAEIDPNYLFSRRLATFGKMHLQKIPRVTTIRDQVICLQPEFFGELGVVIGFDDKKFEVMFSKPSFGKTDLNGLCSELWAGRFYQRDLFNFQTWPQVMRKREKVHNLAQNIGWDGYKQEMKLVPKFREKALKQFADVEKLAQKLPFNKEFLEFIQAAKKNQKVEKIDPEFQVVDNRQKQWALKYDKGTTTIEKQYVQKVIKDKKYIEKPVEQIVKEELHVEEYEKQIIENKLEKKVEVQEAPKVPETEAEGEDDGDDMFN